MVRGNLAGRTRSVRTALAGLLAGLVWIAVAVVPASSVTLSTDNTLADLNVYNGLVDLGPSGFSGTNNGTYTLTSVGAGVTSLEVVADPSDPNFSKVELSTDGFTWDDISVPLNGFVTLNGPNLTTHILVRVTAEDETVKRRTYTLAVQRGSGSVTAAPSYSAGLDTLSCFQYDNVTSAIGDPAGFGAFSSTDYLYDNAGSPLEEALFGGGWLYCTGGTKDADALVEVYNETGPALNPDGWVSLGYGSAAFPFDSTVLNGFDPLGSQSQFFYVRVSTPDGVDRVYKFEVFVATPGVDADLADLGLKRTGGANIAFLPVFDATTYDYSADTDQNKIVVVTDRNDPNASVAIRNHTLSNTFETVSYQGGSEQFTVDLTCGVNIVDVRVKSSDGTVQNIYSIAVTSSASCVSPTPTPTPTPTPSPTSSPAPSNNANLSNLVCTTCTLSPAFAAATTAYTSTVAQTVGFVTVTPTAADTDYDQIRVRVNAGAWQSVTSGAASGALLLNIGANTIQVEVTAEDGSTIKTYSLVVTRTGIGFLENLSVAKTDGTIKVLEPVFSSNTFAYATKVGNKATAVTVRAKLLANYTTAALAVSVNGGAFAALAQDTTSGPLALNVGSNTITVRVTSGSTVQTYVITVTRKAQPCVVPNVVGVKLSVAKARLKAHGCGFVVTKVASDTVGAGRVIKSTPAQGKRRPNGFKVKLLVSLG